MLDDLLAS